MTTTAAPVQHNDDVLGLYRSKGIGARLKPGRTPALLVVDLINGFTDPAYDCGFACHDEVAQTAQLIDAARASGTPVIFSTIVLDRARQEMSIWLEKMPALGCLLPESEAVAVDGRLTFQPSTDILIEKRAASCFTGTDLSMVLTQQSVDTLIVCGATTSGCVRATVVDACMNGFRTFVPATCVADRARAPHEASLFDIQAKYGDVVDFAVGRQLVVRQEAA